MWKSKFKCTFSQYRKLLIWLVNKWIEPLLLNLWALALHHDAWASFLCDLIFEKKNSFFYMVYKYQKYFYDDDNKVWNMKKIAQKSEFFLISKVIYLKKKKWNEISMNMSWWKHRNTKQQTFEGKYFNKKSPSSNPLSVMLYIKFFFKNFF